MFSDNLQNNINYENNHLFLPINVSWIQQLWLYTPLDRTDALLSSSSCNGQQCETEKKIFISKNYRK